MGKKSLRWDEILLAKLIQASLLGACLLLLRMYPEGWLVGLLLVPMLFLVAFILNDWETGPKEMIKMSGLVFAIIPMGGAVKLLFLSPFLIGFGIAFLIYGEEALGLGTLIGWGLIIVISLLWNCYKKLSK